MRAWVRTSRGWRDKMRHFCPLGKSHPCLPLHTNDFKSHCLSIFLSHTHTLPLFLFLFLKTITWFILATQECEMWFIAMQRRRSATAPSEWSRYNEFQNYHINQGNRIRVQVSGGVAVFSGFACFIFCECRVWVGDVSVLLMFSHRTTSGPAITRDYTEDGLVRDGTPCGKNLVCVNQTCVSIFPYIDQTKCPTDGNNVECYGKGVSQHRFLYL